MEKLDRVKDLLKTSDTQEALDILLTDYLSRKDPVEKAKRVLKKAPKTQAEHSVRNVKTDKAEPREIKKESLKKSLFLSPTLARQTLRASADFKRKKLPARLVHQVYLQDEGHCQFVMPEGQTCQKRRYLEIHHKKPVSHGGEDTLENLQLLCSAHHKIWHRSLVDASHRVLAHSKTRSYKYAHQIPSKTMA